MNITQDTLRAIVPAGPRSIDVFVPHLNAAMAKYEISTLKRIAAFLAQVAHESGGFRYVREIWGPTATQKGYDGRSDLGNIEPGDGPKYRGRGLIQTTGRANYIAAGKELGLDLLRHPELLEVPEYAALSAAWFWKKHGLNELADKGDFKGITKRINGGYNGLAKREIYWARAKHALGA